MTVQPHSKNAQEDTRRSCIASASRLSAVRALHITAIVLAGLFLSALPVSQLNAQGADAQRIVLQRVELAHRHPDQVRQALASHLDARTSISQIGNILVITSPQATMAELLRQIEQLDIPRSPLQIQVNFDYQGENDTATESSAIQQHSVLESERLELHFLSDQDYSASAQQPDGTETMLNQGDADSLLSLTAEIEEYLIRVDYSLGPGYENLGSESVWLSPGRWQVLEDTVIATRDDAGDENAPILNEQRSGEQQRRIAVRVDRAD